MGISYLLVSLRPFRCTILRLIKGGIRKVEGVRFRIEHREINNVRYGVRFGGEGFEKNSRQLANQSARWLVIFFDNNSRGLWMRLRNSTRTKMAL